MYNFFKFLNIFGACSRIPLSITDFREVRYDSAKMTEPNEYFVNRKPGGILLEYYDKDKRIGYIRYYITTGQIGLFFIDKEYQNRGLGKQILSKVIEELHLFSFQTPIKNIYWNNIKTIPTMYIGMVFLVFASSRSDSW